MQYKLTEVDAGPHDPVADALKALIRSVQRMKRRCYECGGIQADTVVAKITRMLKEREG